MVRVETRASFQLGVLDGLAGSFEEATLLELDLTLNLLALNIGDEEGRNQVLDDDLGLVALLLHLVEEVVDLAHLQLGLVVSLQRRGVVDGLHNHRLQVAVDRSLMDLHELSVEDVLTIALDLFGLTLARLLSLTLATLVLGKSDHRVDATLLLQAHKLLGERVHRLRDDRGLNSLSHAIHDTLLVVVDQHMLFLSLRVLFPLLSGSELSNEVKSLLFAFEHHVLFGTTSEKSLQKDDSTLLLVTSLPFVDVGSEGTILFGHLSIGGGGVGAKRRLIVLVLVIGGRL